MFTITQVAKKMRCTRQAVYVAIKKKRLKAKKGNGRWWISKEAIDTYKKTKYTRDFTKKNGKLVVDPSKGEIYLTNMAKVLKISPQKLYYACNTKKIPYTRKGPAYVLKIAQTETLRSFFKKNLKSRTKKTTYKK